MNKPVTGADLVIPKVTTGSLPASRKVYSRPEAAPDLRVPIREISLDASSGEPPLPVYDTTGPYTDPNVTIDVEKGLARNRIAWVKERGGVEEYEGAADQAGRQRQRHRQAPGAQFPQYAEAVARGLYPPLREGRLEAPGWGDRQFTPTRPAAPADLPPGEVKRKSR